MANSSCLLSQVLKIMLIMMDDFIGRPDWTYMLDFGLGIANTLLEPLVLVLSQNIE